MEYRVSARDYLLRARNLMQEPRESALFYAAFELRAGTEARLAEYLDEQRQVSKKLRQGWQVATMAKGIDQAFRLKSSCARFAYHSRSDRTPAFVLYYTPVSATLQKNVQKLGNYLHRQKKFRPQHDKWWQEFEGLLVRTEQLLLEACTGTMLGPPLMRKGTKRVDMRVEVLDDSTFNERLANMTEGTEFVADIRYPKRFPTEFEDNAIVWSPQA